MVFTRNTVPVSDKVWRRFHFPLTMCHAFPSQQCFRHPALQSGRRIYSYSCGGKYKLQFYVLGKEEPYEIYGHLKNVKDALQSYRFALANQGCLINLRYVYGKADDEVCLVYHDKKGRQEIAIPVSRRQRKDLQQRIRDFMLEEGTK